MLTGFVSSLLSGAEEQDEKIQIMINDMLQQINARVGDKFYISTLWLLLLKNSKNRIATFKVLNKKFLEIGAAAKLPKGKVLDSVDPALQEMSEKISETNGQAESFYPNTLMIANSFAACLEDEDISTRKNCLDFVIKFIDLDNNALFDDYKKEVIFVSLVRILDNNDLSIVRRVFKMLFDANDLNAVELTERNKRMLLFLGKGHKAQLSLTASTAEDLRRPFKVLAVLHKSNDLVTRSVVKQNAMAMTEFMFQHGYIKPTDFNTLMIEQTKTFIKDFESYLEDFLEAINLEIRQSPMNTDQLLLVEFVMKVLVVESNIPNNAKFRFMISLMDAIFQQFDRHFEKALSGKRYSAAPGEDPELVRTRRLDKIIQLLSQCVIILDSMMKSSKIAVDSGLQRRVHELLVKDAILLEEIMANEATQNEIIQNYSKIFTVLMEIDTLQSLKGPGVPEVTSFAQLPRWLQSQFTFLQSKSEIVSYSALQFLYSMFEFERKSPIVASYNQFIYKTKVHYEPGNVCMQLMNRVVEMIEIYDFKRMALRFLYKLITYNFIFVSTYLLNILAGKRAEDFNKVAMIWNATSANVTSDVRLVLQETVFEMLSFIEIQDLMIGHYFKSWLNQNTDNLSIVLQTVLKSLIKFSSWSFSDKAVVYKVPFECDAFMRVLKHLETIYEQATFNFLNYIYKTKIPVEFEFYDEEMSIVLKNHFVSEENSFFGLILKIFLRYVVGSLDAAQEDQRAVSQHNAGIDRVKEAIVLFLEKLLRALEKMDVIKIAVIPMIRIFAQLIEGAFMESKAVLQIAYLSFLEFLLFKTGLVGRDVFRDDVYQLITTSRIMPCFLLSLKSNSYYVVKEFVRFGCELNFLLAKFLKYPALFKEVNQVIFFYLDGILSRCDQSKSLKEEEAQKAIVTELMNGLRTCLSCFLQVDEIEERVSSSPVEQAFLAVFTLGMVQPKEELKKKVAFVRDENTTKHLLNSFEKIFSMLSSVWKKMGLIPEAALYALFDAKSLQPVAEERSLVGISKQIVEIFKPLGITFLEATAESFVENWIANNDAGDANKDSANPDFENAKILEIILCLQITPVRLLFSLLGGKQLKTLALTKRYSSFKKEKDLVISRKVMTYECSFLSFLYAYLRYLQTTDNIAFELYGILSKILHQFDQSTTPATLCWLIDILSLALDRFPLDFTQHSGLKLEFVNLLSDLIIRTLKTIFKETVMSYKETEKPFKMVYPLNPSAVEYLKTCATRSIPKNTLNTEESDITS